MLHSRIHTSVALVALGALVSGWSSAGEAAEGRGDGAAQFLNSPQAQKLGFPFSEAVQAGDFLFLSGQIGNPEGATALVPGGIAAESRQTLQNVKRVLEQHGHALRDVVKCTVFLVDMSEWPEFNKVYREFFTAPFPARTAVGVKELVFGARVELECIAFTPQRQ